MCSGQGDPHFKTIDGVRYTLNIKGELILLRNKQKNLMVQVRTEIYTMPNGDETAATIFTAFALKFNSAAPVHIGLGSGEEGKLTLFVNNEEVDLTDVGMRSAALEGGVQ